MKLTSKRIQRISYAILLWGLLNTLFGQTFPTAFGDLVYTPYTVTTLAGTAYVTGFKDGTGPAALLHEPTGMTIDASGNIYFVDQYNCSIRKITPAGVVTTVATDSEVQFMGGIVMDTSGNFYVSNLLENTIYKVTPDGKFTLFAGTPNVAGSADGTGTAATFYTPGFLALDGNGNLFLTDTANRTIRKITPGGVVTTFAGTPGVTGGADGVGAQASFSMLSNLTFDTSGNLFVTDGSAVRKISPAGVVTTIAGSTSQGGAADGPALTARFFYLEGIAVDAGGNVFVVDSENDLIREISADGQVNTLAGYLYSNGESDGTGLNAAFRTPGSMVLDADGNFYVADSYADTIRKGVSASLPAVSVASNLPIAPVANGSSAITLTATATGGVTGYQWFLNGVAIVGATSSTETVYPTAANEGAYSVSVTNANGSVSAPAGTLAVSTNAWLVNLSARAYAETGANQLIAGFVTTGAADKALLIRGDGPSLASFGITDFLSDPQLTLLSGSTILNQATSWSSSLASVFAQVGAFSLPEGSHDTALLESLAPGSYTAQIVSQTTNNGVALAEIYDADSGAPANRLINISARAFVGASTNILIGGFVIGGTTPLTVVIRGDGPALAGFGLSGALPSTILTLSDSAGTIATNSGWGSAPSLGSAATGGIVVQPLTAALSAKVGAFSLSAGSGDSAIVATLPPGAYTAILSGVNAGTGVGLVEIYEIR